MTLIVHFLGLDRTTSYSVVYLGSPRLGRLWKNLVGLTVGGRYTRYNGSSASYRLYGRLGSLVDSVRSGPLDGSTGCLTFFIIYKRPNSMIPNLNKNSFLLSIIDSVIPPLKTPRRTKTRGC